MHFFRTKNKFAIGALTAWVALVMLVAPIQTLAVDEVFVSDNQLYVFNPETGTYNPAGAATDPRAFASGESGTTLGDLVQDTIEATGTCSVSAILGQLLSSLISRVIQGIVRTISQNILGPITSKLSGLLNKAISPVTNAISNIPVIGGTASQIVSGTAGSIVGGLIGGGAGYRTDEVPVYEKDVSHNSQLQVNKDVGGGWGPPTGIPVWVEDNVSQDAIMFCIVNQIIAYITEATRSWINSGFNGNPVFVQNPAALLQRVADQEAASFIYNLEMGMRAGSAGGLGVAGPTGAVSLYPPIAEGVINNLAYGYNSSFASEAMRRPVFLPQNKEDYDAFLAGRKWYGMGALMEVADPMFNTYGLTLTAMGAMQQNISAAQQAQQTRLGWSNGVIAPTTCPEHYVRPDGTCSYLGITDTASGRMILDTLKNRDMMTYMRVALVKDFDSLITSFVNQLIRVAVTEGLQAIKGKK